MLFNKLKNYILYKIHFTIYYSDFYLKHKIKKNS